MSLPRDFHSLFNFQNLHFDFQMEVIDFLMYGSCWLPYAWKSKMGVFDVIKVEGLEWFFFKPINAEASTRDPFWLPQLPFWLPQQLPLTFITSIWKPKWKLGEFSTPKSEFWKSSGSFHPSYLPIIEVGPTLGADISIPSSSFLVFPSHTYHIYKIEKQHPCDRRGSRRNSRVS